MLQGYRTIISAAVVLLSEVARISGAEVSVADINGAVNSALSLGGALAAIYYRTQAGK